MRDHIIGVDYELWDVVTDGPLATMKKNVEGVDVPKTRADCNVEDLKKWEKNAKAKKWLVCGLSLDEYSKIQRLALSTVETEYIDAASCCAQLLWIKQQFLDFGIEITDIFTKALSRESFQRNRLELGMIKIT
uniref:Uncharacterized protein LOC104239003 n=1 Tax=Nicotiana sylvestris TaxID=4096 RepID=A0A1U7XQE3_NICSY|nr:PREDICTED: uncharacterized protein LOC104239003 [Nicotiana sylvestris]